ncbi:hypothetical protein KY332_04370 [Candidatus Woesearchaeota archaeon]|nr:hypothetical protein [Candidatus Woesearchaeota archaeon]
MANVNELLEKGYVHTKVIVELIGKPKEHIEKTLKEYVDHIKKKTDLEVLREEFGEAKELEGDDKGLFATFVELEFMAKDIPTLIGFCFDYMPSSIEIIAPAEFKLKGRDITAIMNDLQGKLHKLDMGVKQLNNQNQFLKQNVYSLSTNIVSLALNVGVKKVKDLAKLTGMSEEHMKDFLESLIKKGLVKKEGEDYSWINDERKE